MDIETTIVVGLLGFSFIGFIVWMRILSKRDEIANERGAGKNSETRN